MVSVQVGNNNHTHIIQIDTISIHPDQRLCAAVDQELTAAIFDQNAALQPAATSEGITAA